MTASLLYNAFAGMWREWRARLADGTTSTLASFVNLDHAIDREIGEHTCTGNRAVEAFRVSQPLALVGAAFPFWLSVKEFR